MTAATPVPFLPLAHGVGSRHDLPLSPFYAYAGAFAALFVSFLALGLLWSASRFRGAAAGRRVDLVHRLLEPGDIPGLLAGDRKSVV